MVVGGEESRLYIGLDESNHGRFPEIIVAVSSFVASDASSVVTSKKERMKLKVLWKFLQNDNRDFRYTQVKRGTPKRNKNYLIQTAPLLIGKILENCLKNNEPVDALSILIDGHMRDKDFDDIDEGLDEVQDRMGIQIGSISYKPYPKGGKRYNYNRILTAADSLAHSIFRNKYFEERTRAQEKEITLY